MKLNQSVFRSLLMAGLVLLSMGISARTITGTVTDQTGETIISASVIVKGTTIGTVTDFDGNYELDVPDDAKELVFSYIGLETQELPISGNVMNVVLKENSEVLEEVVVTGYGTTKKRDLVTSVSSVGADQLKDIPVASAGEALQGKLAGVSVTATEGSPDADMKIRVRGGTSLTQSSDPLYIVDGFPVSSISDIAPGDIQSMDVLKDAAATAIYGAQGANGVIIITTKDTKTTDDKMVIHADYTGYMGWRSITKKYDVMNAEDFVKMQYEFHYMNNKGSANDIANNFNKYFDPNYAKVGSDVTVSANFHQITDYWNTQKYTNWQDEIFTNSLNSNHTFSVSGGTKAANFNFTYNRVDDKSIMYGSNYNRNNLSLKTKFQPIKGLNIAATLRFTNTNVLGSGTNSATDNGSKSETRLRNAVAYSPIAVILPEEDEDGGFGNIYQPKQAIDDNYKNKVDNKLNLNGYVSYKFLKHFTVKAEIGYEYRNVDSQRFYGPSTYYSRSGDGNAHVGTYKEGLGFGNAIETNEASSKLKQTNTFEYAQKYDGGNHDFSLLIGEEQTITRAQEVNSYGYGFDPSMRGDEVFRMLGQAKEGAVMSYYSPKDNLLSFFARANYSYKGRYYLTGTFRADGSSRFSRGHQWGYFPSVAIAWRMIDEEWMEPAQDVMSNFKFRLSYGSVGNNNVPLGYLNTSYYSDNTKVYMQGMTNILINGRTPANSFLIAANPNLKWETTITRDFGIDYGFFNERLSGSLDLYWNNTKDLILLYRLATGGYNYQYRNIGSTDNKGVEFSIKGVILDHHSKSLNYGLTLDANIAYNYNKVADLGGLNEYSVSSQCFSTYYTQGYEYKLVQGERVGNIYGYKTDGIYTTADFQSYNRSKNEWYDADGKVISTPLGNAYPGMQKIADTDGKEGINENDMTVLGNATPIVNGGFNLGFYIGGDKWGKIDLSANFTYSIGNDVVNMSALDYTTVVNSTKGRNMLSSVGYGSRYSLFEGEDMEFIPKSAKASKGVVSGEDYAKMAARIEAANEGKTTANPYNEKLVLTDKYVEDASFMRLSSLTFGYSLSQNWIKKAHISQLRIFFSASNLFVVTKYSGLDPEVDTRSKLNPLCMGVDYGAFPKSRGFNFGINLSFE